MRAVSAGVIFLAAEASACLSCFSAARSAGARPVASARARTAAVRREERRREVDFIRMVRGY
jgi:hypothetical protein